MGRISRPDWVREIELTEGVDADGEPALWVWIVLEADTPTQEVMQPALSELRQHIKTYLAGEVPGLWAYVRVREAPGGSGQEA
ncbi:MAG: hypothetical protein ACLFMW_09210 [Ectothiorhodospira sp.]